MTREEISKLKPYDVIGNEEEIIHVLEVNYNKERDKWYIIGVDDCKYSSDKTFETLDMIQKNEKIDNVLCVYFDEEYWRVMANILREEEKYYDSLPLKEKKVFEEVAVLFDRKDVPNYKMIEALNVYYENFGDTKRQDALEEMFYVFTGEPFEQYFKERINEYDKAREALEKFREGNRKKGVER